MADLAFGVPTDEELEKINGFSPKKMSKEEVFVFPVKMAGDMIIPDRFIQISPKDLKQFVKDAQSGVSMLLDHSWSADGFFGIGGRPKMAMPYGRVFDAWLKDSLVEGENTEIYGNHYMHRSDSSIDGISTNALIEKIEAGTLFDTSVGFGVHKYKCSICGEDYRKCNHYAGKTYEVEGEDGVTRNSLCWIITNGANLYEDSIVFDGAYPTAGVRQSMSVAQSEGGFENESGQFLMVDDLKNTDPNSVVLSTYSKLSGMNLFVRKNKNSKNISLFNNSYGIIEKNGINQTEKMKGGDNVGDETKTVEELTQQVEELTNKLSASDNEKDKLVSLKKDDVKEQLGAELEGNEILSLAKMGQTYKTDLVADTISWGIKAQGNEFKKELWEKTLNSSTVDDIKAFKTDFEKQAKESIPTGKNTVTDDETQGNGIPDEAYVVGK